MQPYQFHWVRDRALQANLAIACNGQKAAASAAEFIVIVASPALGLRTADAQLAHVESSSALGADSKIYYRKQIGMFQKILGMGSSVLWSPLVALAALIKPTLSLIPIGHIGGAVGCAQRYFRGSDHHAWRSGEGYRYMPDGGIFRLPSCQASRPSKRCRRPAGDRSWLSGRECTNRRSVAQPDLRHRHFTLKHTLVHRARHAPRLPLAT